MLLKIGSNRGLVDIEMINVFNLSFGKDSMATLILAAEQGIPIDRVLYVDIKFNDEISGEHPIMAEWIPFAEKRLKELFGITVDHAYSGIGYETQFWTKKQKGEHKATIPQMKMPQFIFVPMVEWLRDKYGIQFMEEKENDERRVEKEDL